MKLDNRGFLLVETLIVSLFIMAIFAMLYTNMFPLVGEYQRYKNYDTVEATYLAHWARKLVLRGVEDSSFTTAKNTGYIDISNCALYAKSGKEDTTSWCELYKATNDVTKIYLTPYQTNKLKLAVKNNTSYSRAFQEYVKYLPTYEKNSTKTAASNYYRVIIEYQKYGEAFYGTIEVKK